MPQHLPATLIAIGAVLIVWDLATQQPRYRPWRTAEIGTAVLGCGLITWATQTPPQ